MDKNILEEYQNRVENVRKTLEKNQEIVEEGVEASQSRTDNRLEELQSMLEETQRPIDMSDVGIGVTGSFARDSRASTIRDSYSNDREGYLLSEYDKRRVDPGEPNVNVERIVEEIRRVREAKRMAQEEAIRAEMQDLIDEQAFIEDVREAQGEKAQLVIVLQEEKDRIEADIQIKKDRIEAEKQKSDKSLEEVDVHKKTLALYSDKGSKVYMAAKGEVKRCREKARRARVRIGKLESEIASLDQDLETLDALLYEVDGRRDEEIRIQRETAEREWQEAEEQARQEAEMWEAYRAEQARKKQQEIDDEIARHNLEKKRAEEQASQEDEMWEEYRAEQARKKQQEIEYGVAKNNLEQRRAEAREKVNEEKAKASEAKIIEQYADGLNLEEDLSKYDNWKPSTTAKPQQTQPPKSEPKQGKWKIESVTFTIEGGSKPVYKVLVSNGKEQEEVISDEVAVLDLSRDKEEIATLTNKQKIENVEKYYDKGLTIALQVTDKEYGTTGFEEYKQLLRDKEMIRRYPDRYEDSLKISYDFSNLLVKPNEEMKRLQKIAQANQNRGVVSRVKRRPGLLMRLIKKFFVKAIPAQVGEDSQREEDLEETSRETEEIMNAMKLHTRNIDENEMESMNERNWEELHSEPDFDIETFVEGMPESEANKYRAFQALYDEQQALEAANPYKGFRTRMKEEAQAGGNHPEVEPDKGKTKELEDPFLDL